MGIGAEENGSQFLSTVFLANRAKVNKKGGRSYAVSLGVRVPDYEIEKKLWVNKHYEGSYLFRDSIVLELIPPAGQGERWKVTYAWQGQGTSTADTEIDPKAIKGGKIEIQVPLTVAPLLDEWPVAVRHFSLECGCGDG